MTLKVEVAASYVLFGVQERGEEDERRREKMCMSTNDLNAKKKKNPAG